MRRSGYLLPAAAALFWFAAVAYPLLAFLQNAFVKPQTEVITRSTVELFITTSIWALTVAVIAAGLGWLPGRLLGNALRKRGYVPLAISLLAPLCVPAYIIFWCWWQVWPEGSDLFRWAVRTDHVTLLKNVTLLVGLVCWSWPLVAWCVAGCVADNTESNQELLKLDGAPAKTRLLAFLRSDSRGLAIGALIVFLVTFNNTTCFDLAGIFSFGNELRAIDALGAHAPTLLYVATPSITIAIIGCTLVWFLLKRTPIRQPKRTVKTHKSTIYITIAIWLISVGLPIVLLLSNLSSAGHLSEFINLYGPAVTGSAGLAITAGGLGIVIALGLAAAWQDHRPIIRAIAHILALTWMIAAVVPGTIVGVAMEAAYNLPLAITNSQTLADMIYTKPIILVLGYIARFGFIGALLGRWIAASEPADLKALRLIDGAQTLGGWLRASWPRLLAGGIGSAAVITALSISEIPVTARLQPPGDGSLAGAVLNALHYQRPETVMFASLILIGAAIVAALIAILTWAVLSKSWTRTTASIVLLTLCICFSGCEKQDSTESSNKLDTLLVFGSPGISLGQFDYPRALAVDKKNKYVYIVDKTARVQRFGFDGKPQLQWSLPKSKNGKPTGISVDSNGRVFVPDTHYHQIIKYDSEGYELMRFGSYGEEPGKFIYPTDVAFGPDGTLYVSEYGGANDRIQVFSAQGKYLFGFGSFGEGDGEFSRPQSILFNDALTELYIADSCNHRIVVVDPKGNTLRTIGSSGRSEGQLAYPYSLIILKDGSLLICEYGNNRIQRLTNSGNCLGIFGRPGNGDGELYSPWALDGSDSMVFVLDSKNTRVQVIRTPS